MFSMRTTSQGMRVKIGVLPLLFIAIWRLTLLRALEALSNGILRDERVFHIDRPD